MSRKLVVKRLTQSDLTLFEWHYRNYSAGNQKAINLNANVFIDELYPILPDLAAERGGRIPLDLQIYGPGTNTLHNLQRKIIKNAAYKNWRLNGEFIYNPPDEENRYNVLVANDIAIFEFYGIDIPFSAKIIFIANSLEHDKAIYNLIVNFLGAESMKAITNLQLEDIITNANQSINHPIFELLLESELESAVYSGDFDLDTIHRKPFLRKTTKEDFVKAKKNAEENGRRGEEIINNYLINKSKTGTIKTSTWISNINPIFPYDFLIQTRDGIEIFLDVKTTQGDFDNDMYISYNELKQMSYSPRYDLYRVFLIQNNNAKLRIFENTKQFAVEILKILNTLPNGVKSNGISVSPSTLNFGETINIDVSIIDEEL